MMEEIIVDSRVEEKIDLEIKKVWMEDLRIDYEKSYILKEDSLKNAFYYHLRTRLGESFLIENNLRIFTEYHINGERVDLVLVEIDPVKVAESNLGDSVKSIVATVEMKHKTGYVNDSIFIKILKRYFRLLILGDEKQNIILHLYKKDISKKMKLFIRLKITKQPKQKER